MHLLSLIELLKLKIILRFKKLKYCCYIFPHCHPVSGLVESKKLLRGDLCNCIPICVMKYCWICCKVILFQHFALNLRDCLRSWRLRLIKEAFHNIWFALLSGWTKIFLFIVLFTCSIKENRLDRSWKYVYMQSFTDQVIHYLIIHTLLLFSKLMV